MAVDRSTWSCPECNAPFDLLAVYLDPDGPYHGCRECGWIEPHGPGMWTTEKLSEVLEGEETSMEIMGDEALVLIAFELVGWTGDYARRIVLAVDGNQQSKGPRPFIEAPSLLLATRPSFRPPYRSSGGGGRPPKADPNPSS